jgi:hypothetical protein
VQSETFLCLREEERRIYVGSGGMPPCISNLSSRWRFFFSFTNWPLCPSRRSPHNHWIGGWVGSMADLDVGAKRFLDNFVYEFAYLLCCLPTTKAFHTILNGNVKIFLTFLGIYAN